jgi:bifunctional non-homologous end joining protein LigD
MVRAAQLVRATLEGIGLESWLKTTGGDGLHIVVPIRPEHEWPVCLAAARAIAETLERKDASRYTTRFARQGREQKILIDYLRNNRTNTSVAAYSVRAGSTAAVSVPIAWDELSPRRRPPRWMVRTIGRRLAANDPWAGYFQAAQRLPL